MKAQNPSAWSSHWLLSVINWKESLAPSSILALEFIIMQRVLKEGGGFRCQFPVRTLKIPVAVCTFGKNASVRSFINVVWSSCNECRSFPNPAGGLGALQAPLRVQGRAVAGVQGAKSLEAQVILRFTKPKNAEKLFSYLICRLRFISPHQNVTTKCQPILFQTPVPNLVTVVVLRGQW